MKTHANLSIDTELMSRAKDKGLNVSEITEIAIAERLRMTELKTKPICGFCGKDEVLASKENDYIGLTWLWPDDKWICESCLKWKIRQISVVGSVSQ